MIYMCLFGNNVRKHIIDCLSHPVFSAYYYFSCKDRKKLLIIHINGNRIIIFSVSIHSIRFLVISVFPVILKEIPSVNIKTSPLFYREPLFRIFLRLEITIFRSLLLITAA